MVYQVDLYHLLCWIFVFYFHLCFYLNYFHLHRKTIGWNFPFLSHTFMILRWSWRSWITSFPSDLLLHHCRTRELVRSLLQKTTAFSLGVSPWKFNLQMPQSILDVELAWYLQLKIYIEKFSSWGRKKSFDFFSINKMILYKWICLKETGFQMGYFMMIVDDVDVDWRIDKQNWESDHYSVIVTRNTCSTLRLPSMRERNWNDW